MVRVLARGSASVPTGLRLASGWGPQALSALHLSAKGKANFGCQRIAALALGLSVLSRLVGEGPGLPIPRVEVRSSQVA